MAKVSIIIPSYKEPYLWETLNDILKKAEGDFEVLVNIDGIDKRWPKLIYDRRITYFHNDKPLGMRGGINKCIKASKGKYLIKVDAHCLFAPGFDVQLQKDIEKDWCVIPRRYALNADGWKIEERSPFKDYHYIHYPCKSNHTVGTAMFPQVWEERTEERKDNSKYIIDDTMAFQGSFWFVDKKYFMGRVGYLQKEGYSTFAGEQLEIGLKYWLGGGKVKVNKKTWYAHLFKNRKYYDQVVGFNARKYKKELRYRAGWNWLTKHWLRNEEPNMIHKFDWLIEKFWPVPSWPEDKSKWII